MSSVRRILYACIADSRKVVVEVGDGKAYREVTKNVMERCALDVRKSFVHQDGNISLNYISEGNRIWFAVADKDLSTRVVFGYLEYVKRRSPEGGEKDSSGHGSLMHLMSSQLNTFTSSTDRISQVNAEIDSIKEVMMENLDLMLRRGERLEDLFARSEALQQDAALFNRNATKLKSHFRWANIRWYLIALAVIIVIALGITWGLCGLRFQNCRKKK
jgi:vesicle-associated membrane protein 7